MKIDVFYLRVICTCDQCDSQFCALQLTALIKPNWCILLNCCACLHHSLIVVQPSWTTVPCPTTKLGLFFSKSFAGIMRDKSVVSVALRTPLKTSLGILIKVHFRIIPIAILVLHQVDPPHLTTKLRPWVLRMFICHKHRLFVKLAL